MLPGMAKSSAALIGRVGGLAIALGIGGAVATGLAAQASAAPADSASGAASSVSTGRGAAAVAKAPARRTPSAARSAALAVPRASAPVVKAPRLRSAPSADSVAVAPRAVAAAITPSDIWSSLMTRIAGIFGWDPRGRQMTIYKGTHFVIPNNFGFFMRNVTGSATFTPNTTYDLGDSDQWDWNKLTGIAFTPLEPDRNSAMVGWRYNLETQLFEIAPFYNNNKVRVLPTNDEIISVPADETFTYTVDYTGVRVSYGGDTVFKPYPDGLVPNVWTAARVSGWFGGNRAAPRTVSYYIKFD